MLFIKRISFFLASFGLMLIPLGFAYASVSVSIQSLSPSTSISAGTNLSLTVVATGFSNPTYSVSDSLGGSSVSGSNINSSGNFSWTPNQNDVGTHTLTITVSDLQGDTATTQEQIAVSAPSSVSVQSLSPSSSITSGMTVSFAASASGFSSPSYTVSDSFSGSSISNSNINSSGNFSWTPGSNQYGTHNITITVTDSSGHNASATETITVSSAPTVVIQSLAPGSSVNAGQAVTFFASASGFSNPSYSVSDSFGGTTVSANTINSSGNFSWTPVNSDAGTHTITVTAVDSSGHTATASQTITVGGTGASIQGLSPGTTVIVGNPVTFSVAASGFSNPVFTAQDSFSGSSLSNSDINSAGYFDWTPNSSDVGTHDFTIYVNDSSGHTDNVILSITVQTPNIAITSVTPGTNVAPGTALTMTVTPAGFNSPSYTVSDTFSGTTITNANINSSGYFSWVPVASQDGSHTVTVYATDSSGHSANASVIIDVNSGVSVSLTAPSPSTSVAAGVPVTFQAYPYGFTNPSLSVQDSFSGTTITNANINSSGIFMWTPTNADVGTHTITVTGNDIYSHSASTQTTLTVTGSSGAASTTGTLSDLETQLSQAEAKLAAAKAGSSSTSGFVFATYLYPGITNSDVTQLQTVLAQQGLFTGSATGYYGPLTENAVIAFQAAHGLGQLGVVGPATRAALNALESGSVSTGAGTPTGDGYLFNNFIGNGSTGTDVTELQKRLTALGIYSGPITGYYGSLTTAAVMQFQSAHGITQAGYVGPSTRAALDQ
jgi:peptidoglycan hydrolase-like protein with peptidoglycan-binding domain